MNSMEMDLPISLNIPLAQIIVPKLNTQQTQNNDSNIQMDPLVNSPNIVVDDIGDITLEPSVGSHTIINISAPQVVNPSPSSPKATRREKSTKGDLDFDHAFINQYLQHPRLPIPEVPMGSRQVVVVASMNCLQPPIEDSSTH
jgi:hypothetical protein